MRGATLATVAVGVTVTAFSVLLLLTVTVRGYWSCYCHYHCHCHRHQQRRCCLAPRGRVSLTLDSRGRGLTGSSARRYVSRFTCHLVHHYDTVTLRYVTLFPTRASSHRSLAATRSSRAQSRLVARVEYLGPPYGFRCPRISRGAVFNPLTPF